MNGTMYLVFFASLLFSIAVAVYGDKTTYKERGRGRERKRKESKEHIKHFEGREREKGVKQKQKTDTGPFFLRVFVFVCVAMHTLGALTISSERMQNKKRRW